MAAPDLPAGAGGPAVWYYRQGERRGVALPEPGHQAEIARIQGKVGTDAIDGAFTGGDGRLFRFFIPVEYSCPE